MAQRAAVGEIEEQKLKWTGRQYQRMIRKGFSSGLNFISGSENTRQELLKFLPAPPKTCELVYNGLHTNFHSYETLPARTVVSNQFGINLMKGFVLHVGGNQWYKNRTGVIEIYDAWRRITREPLPLLLIGLPPSPAIRAIYDASPYKSDIHFVSDADNKIVNVTYSAATVFLFPSKAEGFGWPIAEAMASGCPVITTDEAPMTEVAGNAGFFISKRPSGKRSQEWAKTAALMVERIASFTADERESAVKAGIDNAKRFDTDLALDKIESIYLKVVESHESSES
jgi:glycosyltransferase involved in cell wall biosynthesis